MTNLPEESKPKSGVQKRKEKFLTVLEATARQRRAVMLRIDGYTYEQIADIIPYASRSGAYKAVKTALRKTLQEPSDELRQITCMRLDKYLEELWRRRNMIIKTDKDGCETRLHIKSVIETALKIEAQRAILLGLNVRAEPPTPDEVVGDADPRTVDMEVLRARARALTLGIHDAEEIKRRTAMRIKELEFGGNGSGKDSENRIIETEARDSEASGTDA